MNKKLCVLSLATLSLSSLNADYIEKAILKGNAAAIKALAKAGLSYEEERIKGYIQLAEDKVKEKKGAVDRVSYGNLAGVDLISASSSFIATAASAILLWRDYHHDSEKTWKGHDKDDTRALFKMFNWAVFIGAADKSIQGAIKLYRDVNKRDKKLEAVDKAEKVLRAVKTLKEANPRIASH